MNFLKILKQSADFLRIFQVERSRTSGAELLLAGFLFENSEFQNDNNITGFSIRDSTLKTNFVHMARSTEFLLNFKVSEPARL